MVWSKGISSHPLRLQGIVKATVGGSKESDEGVEARDGMEGTAASCVWLLRDVCCGGTGEDYLCRGWLKCGWRDIARDGTMREGDFL